MTTATLSRDEIMAMRPEELRIAVAEAKGWTNCHEIGTMGERPSDGMFAMIPRWGITIADTWELVEELVEGVGGEQRGNGYYNILYSWSKRLQEDYEWVNVKEWTIEVHPYGGVVHSATGPTAPIAICRAYLLWEYT